MNPNADNVPVRSVDVPEASESHLVSGQSASANNGGPKRQSSAPEARSSVGMTLPNLGTAVNPLNSADDMSQISFKSATAPSDEDDMSIEKDVIAKARAIVQRTSYDPYLQAKELSKIKAELLKRRYGKEIKLSEG